MVETQKLILYLYPSIEGMCQGEVYSDAGDGYSENRVDRFYLTRNSTGFELKRHQQGSYPFSYQGFRICSHGFNLQRVWINDTAIAYEGNSFELDDFDRIQFQAHQAVEATETELVLN